MSIPNDTDDTDDTDLFDASDLDLDDDTSGDTSGDSENDQGIQQAIQRCAEKLLERGIAVMPHPKASDFIEALAAALDDEENGHADFRDETGLRSSGTSARQPKAEPVYVSMSRTGDLDSDDSDDDDGDPLELTAGPRAKLELGNFRDDLKRVYSSLSSYRRGDELQKKVRECCDSINKLVDVFNSQGGKLSFENYAFGTVLRAVRGMRSSFRPMADGLASFRSEATQSLETLDTWISALDSFREKTEKPNENEIGWRALNMSRSGPIPSDATDDEIAERLTTRRIGNTPKLKVELGNF